MIIFLTIAAFISALFCIRGKYAGPARLVYVFKPLTTVIIIFIAVWAGFPSPSPYGALIMAGLVFALAGDIFLMLPSEKFVQGLAGFLVAQILFMSAFLVVGREFTWWMLFIFVAIGFAIYQFLFPYLWKMKIPVLVYIVFILVMAWRGWENWLGISGTGAGLAAVGALLFMVSDATLAVNRFRRKFHSAEAIILSTYYSAIWAIAISVAWF